MLQLTHAAALQVEQARRARGVPETAGLRLFGQERSGGERLAVGLNFTEVPAADDEVTEQEGMRVFLAPELAAPLSDASLDVEQTPDGPKLVLTER